MTQPIMKYPGAKWAIAPWIVSHFPRVDRVVDAYCGSGAIALSLPWRPRHLILNDLDGDIVNLFRVLRSNQNELIRMIALTPWSRAEYQACIGPRGEIVRTDDPIEDVRRFLVRLWQAHGTRTNGRSGWKHKGGGTKNTDSSTYELWRQLPNRLAAVVEALRSAEIECLPALTVIGRYSTIDTLIYADPPYVLSARNGKLYRHEMTDQDHSELLDALDAHPGPAVLSGYRCDLYSQRLHHWYTVERRCQAEKGNMRTEVLWLNERAASSRQTRMSL